MSREKWIGLAEVAPTPNCVDLEMPAFVNLIGLAWSADDFVDTVRSACATIGLELVAIEDVERWEERIANCDPAAAICEMAQHVTDEAPFAFGTFLTFDEG